MCFCHSLVVTSCGHAFCGPCLLTLWNRNKEIPISCPIDRSTVSILIPSYTLRAAVTAINKVINPNCDTEIQQYNQKFSNAPRTLLNTMTEDITLIRRAVRESLLYKIMVYVTIAFVVLYFLMPYDLIPDTSIIGFIDDIALVIGGIIVLFWFAEWYRDTLIAKALTQRRRN